MLVLFVQLTDSDTPGICNSGFTQFPPIKRTLNLWPSFSNTVLATQARSTSSHIYTELLCIWTRYQQQSGRHDVYEANWVLVQPIRQRVFRPVRTRSRTYAFQHASPVRRCQKQTIQWLVKKRSQRPRVRLVQSETVEPRLGYLVLVYCTGIWDRTTPTDIQTTPDACLLIFRVAGSAIRRHIALTETIDE